MTTTRRKEICLPEENEDLHLVFLQAMSGGKRNISKKQRKGRRSKRRKNAREVGFVYIPEINVKPIQTRCFRYAGAFNNTAAFQVDDFQNMLGWVTNASTTFYQLIDSFRLKRIGITLYAISSTAGIAPVTITWTGDNGVNVVDTMLVGNSMPNHQSFRPPEGSTAWLWQDTTSSTVGMMSIVSSSTNIEIFLDVELEYIVQDGAAISGGPLGVAATFTGVASRKCGSNLFTAVGLSSVS